MAEQKPNIIPTKEHLPKTKSLSIRSKVNQSVVSISSSSSSDSHNETEIKEIQRKTKRQQLDAAVAQLTPTLPREQLLSLARDLAIERSQLQLMNNILHRRLAEYYKKRKQEHVLKHVDTTPDVEEKYQQKLFAYEELKEDQDKEVETINSDVYVVEMEYAERLNNVVKKFEQLQAIERSTGIGLIYSKKGKPIAEKTVQRYLFLQKRKQEQVSALRLRYIRARNAVAELDAVVRKLETLGPGLYVQHYEQLAIDKQNYLTKIEEREDELIKNRQKCTEHNQILAHIREKMSHTDEVIEFTECDLGEAEMLYLAAREDLGLAKTRRDKLRWYLEDEKTKAGLLTKRELLYDFQHATDELIRLKKKKKKLEDNINKMSMQINQARKQMATETMTRVESDTSEFDTLL